MTSIEMSSHDTKKTTKWELYENAAKRQYGASIKVVKTAWATSQLEELKFEISVLSFDPKPMEKKRTPIDINMKEYTNRCEKEVDETLVKVVKTSSKATGNRYSFSSTKGVDWGFGGNIGAQVMNVAIAGGSAGISGNYGKHKSTTTGTEATENSSFELTYEQQEKILVPPMSHVKATITTYSMKYEQGYVLKFSLPSTFSIPVMYKTRCQQTFCGSKTGFITAAQFCSTLPGLCEEDGKVSFQQDGVLSWVGEGSTIDKEVELLAQ